ncbi:MAG: hypothetical protein ACK4WC_13430, partial [Rubrimonas sp.]
MILPTMPRGAARHALKRLAHELAATPERLPAPPPWPDARGTASRPRMLAALNAVREGQPPEAVTALVRRLNVDPAAVAIRVKAS